MTEEVLEAAEAVEERQRSSFYDESMKKLLAPFRKRVEPDWDKVREAMRRGQAAKRHLADEDLTSMFDAVEGLYLEAFKRSQGGEVELRERCHVAIQVVSDLRAYLRAAVANGEAAAREQEKFHQ